MAMNKKPMKAPCVNLDDVPELDETFFQEADLFHGEMLIRRSRLTVVTNERMVIHVAPTTDV
jgi:hypothetical protein